MTQPYRRRHILQLSGYAEKNGIIKSERMCDAACADADAVTEFFLLLL